MKPPLIPDYALIRPIGRGAYGEVWLAQNVMGTLRAVKVVWRQQFESDRPFDREFAGIQKYEPISRSSGGLVHVLHVGRNEVEGYFFYVMELADDANAGEEVENELSGTIPASARSASEARHSRAYVPRTLRADLKNRGRLSTSECLRLALDVTGGLAELHRQGLVHRDVKPGNIIYVNGRAKLADLGLVAANGEGRTFVGTEGYIPPEGPGSPAADLYALGLVLYEASTGLPPERFPDIPSSWMDPSMGDEVLELHDVILKASEGRRERRYRNAVELQADLALLQSGESVRHMRALQRRYARLRASLAVGATLLAGLVIAVLFANYRASMAAESRGREAALRQQAQESLLRAEAAENEARQQLYAALLAQARSTVRSGELGQRVDALDAIRRAAAVSNTAELRREAFAALALADLRFDRGIPIVPDSTLSVLDPAFERLALGRGTNAVEILSVPDLRLLATLPPSTNRAATFAEWSADGRFLAVRRTEGLSAGPEGEVWEVSSGRLLLLLPRTRWAAVAFHPHRPWILGAAEEDSVALWDLQSGQPLKRFPVRGQVQTVVFSPDGQRFGVLRQVGICWVTSMFEVDSGAETKTVTGPRFNAISWDPRDRWIALTADDEIHLHEIASGTTRLLGRHKGEARSAVFTPEGDYLFTGGDEQEIVCWDLRTLERAFGIGRQSSRIQFSANGQRCAVSTSEGLQLHTFERPTPLRELRGDMGGGVKQGAFSPDGRWMTAGGRERLGLWDLSQESPAAISLEARGSTPFFSPDSAELFAFWNDGFSRWHILSKDPAVPTLQPLPVFKPARIYSAGFAGETLVLGMPDGLMPLPAAHIAAGPGELLNVGYAEGQISPDGKWIALRKANQRYVVVLAVEPWRHLKDLECDAHVAAAAFSPRNDELVIATFSSLSFVDTATWKEDRRFPVTLDRNARLVFPPDGRSFWLVHGARHAVLRDARTFEPRLPLPVGMIPLAVSPDGRRLAISVDGRRLQVWDWVLVRSQLRGLKLDWEE
ncbi:MAG: protein kinase [Verrucomicrobiales bacterium]|nr:protein kinase [Verrucomicrobiales bacterium]